MTPPLPTLTIRGLRLRGVHVPMRLPLHTSTGTVGIAPLALIDLETEQGVVGSTYLFCYTPLALKPVLALLAELQPLLQGQPVAPLVLAERLKAPFRLLGPKGPIAMALAGIDMAAWDALAHAASVPLVRLLGGQPRALPAYNSCGLGIVGAERAGPEAERLLEHGFTAIKLRLGYADAAADVAVVRAVRRAIGPDVTLMSDYNQALTVGEALTRIDALAGEGLYWIEEPTAADDHAGHAQVRGKSRLRIQMGENWWGPADMARCVALQACDLGMPDAMKIGGVSGWLRASAIADAAGLPLSSHLFPEVSAHLLAASPTAHWLEYVDWAAPILRAPFEIRDGQAVMTDAPGSGVAWDEDAVARYRVA